MCKKEQKKQLRAEIRRRKELHTKEELVTLSSSVLNEIEKLAAFKKAANILLYYSLDDEVQTASFIKKWYKRKCILLPVMNGDELELKIYKGEEHTDKKNAFHITEPTGNVFNDYDKIEFAIIPGMAFDNKGHRLGRGKGFYDRLLPKIKCIKAGICFNFQVLNEIPCEEFDHIMDEVWTESGNIMKEDEKA